MPRQRKNPVQPGRSSTDERPPSKWRYYDLKRNWRKVRRHLDDPILEALRGHRACYWEVNLALRLAMLVEPNDEWRIISSDEHSTLWDGHHTLFELDRGFSDPKHGIPPESCYWTAYDEELDPGQYLQWTPRRRR